MKKTVLILGMILSFGANVWADDDISGTAQSIYNECDKNIPLITETLVIKGNVEDVKREQVLRKCLKDKIVEISQLFMKKKKLKILKRVSINLRMYLNHHLYHRS